jgi:carbamate kinase
MATDVDGVYQHWGTPQQSKLGKIRQSDIDLSAFPAGSMGPKVEAAVNFTRATGKRAAIGALSEIGGIVDGSSGTNVLPE